MVFSVASDTLLIAISRENPNPVSGSTRFLKGLQDSYAWGVGTGVGNFGDETIVTFWNCCCGGETIGEAKEEVGTFPVPALVVITALGSSSGMLRRFLPTANSEWR